MTQKQRPRAYTGVFPSFLPQEGGEQVIVDERNLTDNMSAVVTYDNPLDNVVDLAHHFFSRCLAMGITPYVVTKKTVFKWQEGFWIRMSDVFEVGLANS